MQTVQPLRLLLLSREYPPETGGGGIGSYVATIAPVLAQRGHEVHVLSCVEGQASLDLTDNGVHLHRRGVPRLLPRARRHFPATTLRVEGAVSRYRAYRGLGVDTDVIEAPDWYAEGLIFALRRTRPLVVHLHTPLGFAERHNPGSFRWTHDRRLADRIERVPIGRADVVTSPSRLLARDLEDEGWLHGRGATIVRYPFDLGPWAGLAPAESAPPRVLMVGRLEGRKAPEVLVRAVAMLKPEIPDLEAVFVGRASPHYDTSYRDWLDGLARALGAPCRFVDEIRREDLASWYASARAVALPSRYDNLPYAGLEAMGAGRPIVCTDRTGTAELVAGTGAGAVVGVDDVTAFANALRPYLLDPAAAGRAGREAHAIVERECSPDGIAEQREACYREAIDAWSRQRPGTFRNR
jgi:glycosyltransferase involved in cell wall biosynthesis